MGWTEEASWCLGQRNFCSPVFGMSSRFGARTPNLQPPTQAFPLGAMPPSKTWMDKGYTFILSRERKAAEKGKGERRTRFMRSHPSSQASQL